MTLLLDRLCRSGWRAVVVLALAALGSLGAARAQDATFSDGELDQMLAPIALYPDSLLSQVLMASTYPADVKDAGTWTKAHPDAKGEAAVKQVESQPWDPSVKSLVAFPQVLVMMNDKPDQVQRLGDAFLADPGRVMDRVQVLRKKAQDAGNLKSNEQQKVSTQTDNNKQVIVVEPAQPSSVYVPVYQPSVVYGTWGWPSYPPTYWPPPPYYYPAGAFVAGVAWGVAVVGISNCLWGGFSWGHNDVNINVNRYNNVNVNNKREVNNTRYEHNSERRRDVPYRDNKSREQYSRQNAGAADRQNYRGKDNRDAQRAQASDTLKGRGADPAAGRQQLQGADRDRAAQAARDTPRADTGNRSGAQGAQGAREGAQGAQGARDAPRAQGSTQDLHRTSTGASRDNALSGAHDIGATRASAERGSASQASMNQHSRGGGGGAHAGGGGGRGGGGGGGRR